MQQVKLIMQITYSSPKQYPHYFYRFTGCHVFVKGLETILVDCREVVVSMLIELGIARLTVCVYCSPLFHILADDREQRGLLPV